MTSNLVQTSANTTLPASSHVECSFFGIARRMTEVHAGGKVFQLSTVRPLAFGAERIVPVELHVSPAVCNPAR